MMCASVFVHVGTYCSTDASSAEQQHAVLHVVSLTPFALYRYLVAYSVSENKAPDKNAPIENIRKSVYRL
eukprot:scaffold24345_cov64-Attheya_sp.AAC.2